jgi:hypothetical protein
MTTIRAPDPFPIFTRTGTPDDMNALDHNIEVIAPRLIADLARAKRTGVGTKSPTLRLILKPEDVRFLAYALVVHRTRRGGVLSEAHLQLLHAALDIRRQSVRGAKAAGLPPVKNLEKFLAAADLQARETNISENRLASKAGVDRKTIRAWRMMKEFKQRVRSTRYFEGNPTEEDRALITNWEAVMVAMNTRGTTS